MLTHVSNIDIAFVCFRSVPPSLNLWAACFSIGPSLIPTHDGRLIHEVFQQVVEGERLTQQEWITPSLFRHTPRFVAAAIWLPLRKCPLIVLRMGSFLPRPLSSNAVACGYVKYIWTLSSVFNEGPARWSCWSFHAAASFIVIHYDLKHISARQQELRGY